MRQLLLSIVPILIALALPAVGVAQEATPVLPSSPIPIEIVDQPDSPNDWLGRAAPPLIGAVVGAVVGAVGAFLLGEASAVRRERRQAEGVKRSVIPALRIEVAANLRQLESLRMAVSGPTPPPPPEDLAELLAFNPLPVWADAVWRAVAPLGVVGEEKAAALSATYSALSELAAIHTGIKTAWTEDEWRRAAAQLAPAGRGGERGKQISAAQYLPIIAPVLCPRWWALASKVLAAANPLEQDSGLPESASRFAP